MKSFTSLIVSLFESTDQSTPHRRLLNNRRNHPGQRPELFPLVIFLVLFICIFICCVIICNQQTKTKQVHLTPNQLRKQTEIRYKLKMQAELRQKKKELNRKTPAGTIQPTSSTNLDTESSMV